MSSKTFLSNITLLVLFILGFACIIVGFLGFVIQFLPDPISIAFFAIGNVYLESEQNFEMEDVELEQRQEHLTTIKQALEQPQRLETEIQTREKRRRKED